MMQVTVAKPLRAEENRNSPAAGQKEKEMTALTMTQTISLPLIDALTSIGRRMQTLRARHADRMEIASLLELDQGRLDDLGITADDVRNALSAPVPPGPSLALSRAISARRWYRDTKIAG
jgi:uncharacterized protein YjiS (DUF1127 family)